jgi:multiple sugar transport system permease protein
VTTDPEWRPISYGLTFFIQEAGSLVHLQMAGSVITILPVVILYLFVQKQFTEGIATTGLKG